LRQSGFEIASVPACVATYRGCGFEVLSKFWENSGKIIAARMSGERKNFYAFGPFRFDSEKRVLVRDGAPVPLGPKVAETLLMLVERAGHLVDKDDLMKGVWPEAFVEEGNLNKNIFVLRKLLGQWDRGREYIETVPKRGYRFVAPVNEATHAEVASFLPTPARADLTGRKVSHYRVLDIVGGGGMGMVYRAEDLKLGRRVALKFLPEELGNDLKALERFEREARAASALDHPNICAIYEFGEHEGQPFLVMPLLNGRTLREQIAEQAPLPTAVLLGIAMQIAEGLDAAHQKGIIHRDIKPANIFVIREGQAKILDFGLAKLASGLSGESDDLSVLPRGGDGAPERSREEKRPSTFDFSVSLTGVAMGTAGYMSPEQVRGEKLDARTDLFSFGLVLYEMATGNIACATFWFAKRQSAFKNLVPELKLRQLTNNSSENRVLGGGISPDGKYVAYSDQKSLNIKVVETGETWIVPQPEVLNGKDVDWDTTFPLWFPDSTTFLANVHPSGQRSSELSPPGTSIWVVSVSGRAPRKLRDDAVASSVSPDGSLITFEENKGRFGDREIWLMGPSGEQARKLYATEEDSSLSVFTWSPDGQRLLYRKIDGSGRSLINRDLKGGPLTVLFPPSEMAKIIWDFTWLPDGRLIYPVREPGAIGDTCNYWGMRLDARTGEPIEKPTRLTNWTGFCMNSTSVTSDGKRLAFLGWSNQGTGYMADLEAGGTRIVNSRHFTLEEGDDAITDWTADSKTVIIVKNRVDHYGIYKQLLNSDTPEPIVSGAAGGSLGSARVSPDGKWVIAQVHPIPGGQATPRPLMRIPITGGSPELIFAVPAWSGFSCARPPSNTCVVTEPTVDHKQMIVTAFDPVKGRGIELVRFDLDSFPTEEGAPLCDISPDGTQLVTSRGQEGPIQILDLRGRAMQVIRAMDFHNLRSLSWAADGKGLFVEDDKKGGTVLLHVDLQGNAKILWKCAEVPTCFGTPSPDGRHLAIYDHRVSANIWMMENF